MRRFVLLLLVVALASAALAADSNRAAALRDRADRVSLQLENDAVNRMHDFRGALLFARLADAWKKVDGLRSRQFLQQAVDIVSSPDKTESDEQLAKRLMVGGQLLEMIADTDPQLALKLAHALADQAAPLPPLVPTANPRNVKQMFGSRLRTLGMKLSQKDPKATASIAEDLLKLRDGNEVPLAILDVAFRDPALADRLYAKAVAEARSSWDYTMLYGLVQLAYPYLPQPPNRPGVSPAIKAQAAGLLSAFLLRPMDTPEQRRDVCRASGIAGQVLPALPPDIASTVAPVVEACKSTPTPESSGFDTPMMKAGDSIDENLRLAANAPDTKTRAQYKLAAAAVAASQGQESHLRALEILRGMTDDERNADYAEFRQDWRNYSIVAMSELGKRHDNQAIEQVLDASPDGDRAGLSIMYALQLLQDNPGLARIKSAETLRILQQYPPDEDRTYAMLLKLYSLAAPEESVLAFRTVIAGLNNFHQVTDEEFRQKGYRPSYITDRMEPLRGAGTILMRLDENTADAVLRDIESPEYRTVFRLGLLYALLDEYEAQTKKPPKAVSAARTSPK